MIGGDAMKRILALILALFLPALPALCETEEKAQPAGYVLVNAAGLAGWLPLPAEGEESFPIPQTLPDGTETLNVLHLTSEGMWMEDATCEGHDCIEQGEVTFENRYERILGNMIICLPNQLVLELYTAEEYAAMTAGR